VVGKVPECINNGRYLGLVEGLAGANNVQATPTIKINGQDFPYSAQAKPADLVAKIKEIVGDVPGLSAAPAAPVPPAAPAPAAPVPAVP
jgi:protein-disulfide isomerase